MKKEIEIDNLEEVNGGYTDIKSLLEMSAAVFGPQCKKWYVQGGASYMASKCQQLLGPDHWLTIEWKKIA